MITNSLYQLIREGGYVFMIPLILLSILSLAVILERMFAFSKRALLPSVAVEKIEKAAGENNKEQLSSILKSERSLSALILQEALKILQSSEGKLSMEKAVNDSSDKYMDWLTGRLWILRAIGHIAPLLGLWDGFWAYNFFQPDFTGRAQPADCCRGHFSCLDYYYNRAWYCAADTFCRLLFTRLGTA